MSMNYFYFFLFRLCTKFKQRWQSRTMISIICSQTKHSKQKANRDMQRCGFSSAMTPWLSPFSLLSLDSVWFCWLLRTLSKERALFYRHMFLSCSVKSWIRPKEKKKKTSLHSFLQMHWVLQAVRRWHTASLYSMTTYLVFSTLLARLLCCLCGFGLYNSCIVSYRVGLLVFSVCNQDKTRYPSRGLAGNTDRQTLKQNTAGSLILHGL